MGKWKHPERKIKNPRSGTKYSIRPRKMKKCSWCGKKVTKPIERYDAGNELHYFHPECWKSAAKMLAAPIPKRN